MKTNITIKLEADLLREIRILAAQEGTSISALLSDRLHRATLSLRLDRLHASAAETVQSYSTGHRENSGWALIKDVSMSLTR